MATRRQEDPSRLPSSPLAPELGNDLDSSLYQELHRVAVGKMRFELRNYTLQPTALVKEAYLHLVGESGSMWRDRRRALSVPPTSCVTFSWTMPIAPASGEMVWCRSSSMKIWLRASTADILAVDEAPNRLSEFDPRQANILEIHFFGGLTF
jgi:RNA polymerase sigma-70 factor (ECF subfamily)